MSAFPLSMPDPATVHRNSSRASASNRSSASESWEWAKLRKITLRQMDKFIDLFPLVLRNEDLNAANEMRITCRRLEEILELVYTKPRPQHIRKLRRRLKVCRRRLGKLRDCDSLLAVADRSASAKKPDSDAWGILRDYLRDRRQRTAQITLKQLGRLNMAIPYLRIRDDFDLDKNNGAIAKYGVTRMLYRRVLRSLDRRWSEFAAAVEQSHHDPCEHVIHHMRIAAKRLRYLVEVTVKLHMPEARGSLDWLKSLQGAVGRWHDLEIMERLLSAILEHRKVFRVERLAQGHIAHLIRHNRQTKKQSAQVFFAMTHRSAGYQQVKKWVAETLKAGIPKPIPVQKKAA